MKSINFKDGFAAGAAWGAARDANLDTLQQAQGAYLAKEAAEKNNAAAKKEEAPSSADENPKDQLEKIDRQVEKKDALGLRRPRKQPGPGLLLRLAHWLNLN